MNNRLPLTAGVASLPQIDGSERLLGEELTGMPKQNSPPLLEAADIRDTRINLNTVVGFDRSEVSAYGKGQSTTTANVRSCSTDLATLSLLQFVAWARSVHVDLYDGSLAA